MYIFQKFKEEVKNFLLNQNVDVSQIVLELPPEGVAGDLAFPCFSQAKEKKASPVKIAEEIATKFVHGELIDKAVSAGPYVNFFADRIKFNNLVREEVIAAGQCFGSLESKNFRIGVEYLSPNSNKPLTIGHCRNGSLGKSLVEILKFSGYDVKSIILYNDRGVHICKSMLAYQKWGEGKTPDELGLKPDHLIGKFYIMFGQKAEADEGLNEEVQLMLKKWEEGDSEVIELWKKMNGWFFEGVNQTLDRVGINFDKQYLESEIYLYGREIVEQALVDGKVYKLDDGAVEADLSDVNLDKKILLRNDGTTVYMVQDLYLAKKKIDDLKLDKSVYVVGSEQIYHFNVLFELLDRFGIMDKSKTYHLAYAMVNAASGKKMSSRKGVGDKWDGLLDELHVLAREGIESRDGNLDQDELERRSEIIGQAALKFVMLNQDVNKSINFNKQEALKFEGETGPYLLYTLARVNSILTKAGVKQDEIKIAENENPELNEMILQCSRFFEVVDKAGEEFNPSIVCHYLYKLSQLLNNFYHKYRVNDADTDEEKQSRAGMLFITKQVLENGLKLLGIEYLEKM